MTPTAPRIFFINQTQFGANFFGFFLIEKRANGFAVFESRVVRVDFDLREQTRNVRWFPWSRKAFSIACMSK